MPAAAAAEAAAAAAGLGGGGGGVRVGDVIEAVDGATAAGRAARDVELWLSGPPGGRVTLRVRRDTAAGTEREMVSIVRRPPAAEAAAAAAWLGAAAEVRRGAGGPAAAADRQARLARLAGRSAAYAQVRLRSGDGPAAG